MTDSAKYLRDWASDIRKSSGVSVDADKLDAIADEIEELQKDLDACRVARDRLARQVDGYKRAGKTVLDKFVGRKKT